VPPATLLNDRGGSAAGPKPGAASFTVKLGGAHQCDDIRGHIVKADGPATRREVWPCREGDFLTQRRAPLRYDDDVTPRLLR
jgi:hypothetical protein